MSASSSFSRTMLRTASRVPTGRMGGSSSSKIMIPSMTVAAAQLPQQQTSWNMAKRSMVSASPVLLEQKTLKLPGLGDSITEGSIVEWTAAVGQAVKEGDVVAMVETDKVTVDIKAEMDGVIVEHFCELDDNVEVGADLYKIDTEAEASVSAGAESTPAPEAATPAQAAEAPKVVAKTEAPAPAAASTKSSGGHRTPSIHFLGKDGWAKRRAPTVVYIPPNYGRPVFTEEEMEALITGGASMAPDIKSYSSGAMFG